MRKRLALLVVAGCSLLPVLPAAASTVPDRVASSITPSPSAAAAAWLRSHRGTGKPVGRLGWWVGGRGYV